MPTSCHAMRLRFTRCNGKPPTVLSNGDATVVKIVSRIHINQRSVCESSEETECKNTSYRATRTRWNRGGKSIFFSDIHALEVG